MEDMTIWLLRAEEIECRIVMVNEKGVSLLLFKDARVDQKLLDETFTPFGWKRSHQVIDGNLYCTVEVWDKEKEQWIGKQDVGTMSYAEKEKGQASDSFKRACFNWGIGRELYTAPFIWIPAGRAMIQKKEREQKYFTYDRFHVWSISYDEEGKINAVTIVNQKNEIVYSMDARILDIDLKTGEKRGEGKAKTMSVPDKRVDKETGVATGKADSKGAGTEEGKMVREQESTKMARGEECSGEEKGVGNIPALTKRQKEVLEKELERTGVALDAVLNRYHLTSAEQMSSEIYKKAMDCLRKSKSKEAA
jgi:hypothetical protein